MSENDKARVRSTSRLPLLLYAATALLALVLWRAASTTTVIAPRDLQALAENNATLEKMLTMRTQENRLIVKQVSRVVDQAGRRSVDVAVVNSTQQIFDLAQQAQTILEEAKPKPPTSPEAQADHREGIDEYRERELKQQVGQLLDSLARLVAATEPGYSPLPAFSASWQRASLQSNHPLLSQTALLTAQVRLQELNARILAFYATQVGPSDLCFDKLYLGVFPRSKIVEEGSRYQATLCLASSMGCGGTNLYPEIETDYGKLAVRYGAGKLIFRAQASQFDARGEAHLAWQGKIHLTNVWLGYDSRPDTTFLLRQDYTVQKKVLVP